MATRMSIQRKQMRPRIPGCPSGGRLSVMTLAVFLMLVCCLSIPPTLATHDQHLLRRRRSLASTTVNARIVGGSQVPANAAYPFFIEWSNCGCGGSLIHDDVMLTAAHCWQEANPSLRTAYIGGIHRGTGPVTRTLTKQIPHPDFDLEQTGLEHDLMLVKLNQSGVVEGSSLTSTIAWETDSGTDADNLPPQAGDTLTVMGYGTTSPTSQTVPNRLRHAQVNALSDAQCTAHYQDAITPIEPELMFCAAGTRGEDSCQGDSGGPIVIHVDGNTTTTSRQLGVVSFGESCGRPQFPGVYARLDPEWIKETICQWSCYPPSDCPPTLELHPCATSPTKVPTGPNHLTLTIAYDNFPHETAILLEHVETATELFFRDYHQSGAAIADMVETFSFDNQPNGTYRIVVGDTGRDGICCEYGRGNLTVTDTTSGDVLWFHNGSFASLVEEFITVPLPAEGKEETTSDNGDGNDIANADDLSNSINNDTLAESHVMMVVPHYQDILNLNILRYPPIGSTHALVINIQNDPFAQQSTPKIDWTLEQHIGDGDSDSDTSKTTSSSWTTVASAPPLARSFSFHEETDLHPKTLYRLVVAGSNTMTSHGWVVLTNGTATTTTTATTSMSTDNTPVGTVVWVLRGNDFADSSATTAHIWVDAQGHLHILSEQQAQHFTQIGEEEQEDAPVMVQQPSDGDAIEIPVAFGKVPKREGVPSSGSDTVDLP